VETFGIKLLVMGMVSQLFFFMVVLVCRVIT